MNESLNPEGAARDDIEGGNHPQNRPYAVLNQWPAYASEFDISDTLDRSSRPTGFAILPSSPDASSRLSMLVQASESRRRRSVERADVIPAAWLCAR